MPSRLTRLLPGHRQPSSLCQRSHRGAETAQVGGDGPGRNPHTGDAAAARPQVRGRAQARASAVSWRASGGQPTRGGRHRSQAAGQLSGPRHGPHGMAASAQLGTWPVAAPPRPLRTCDTAEAGQQSISRPHFRAPTALRRRPGGQPTNAGPPTHADFPLTAPPVRRRRVGADVLPLHQRCGGHGL